MSDEEAEVGGGGPVGEAADFEVDDSTSSARRDAHMAVVILQSHSGRFRQIGHDVAGHLRRKLEERAPFDRGTATFDIWLESPGGDAHAAYKIGLLLKAYAKTIRVVIPDYAKSAATLLTLVGDEIYMGPSAELGPLDAQIGYEQEGMTISALDRVQSLDDLAGSALSLAVSGGAAVLQSTQLSRSETLTAMLDFAAKFYEPVLSKLDPTMLHWSQTLLNVAEHYGERLLALRNCDPSPDIQSLPNRLVSQYPTHGFVIGPEEAKELGLPVRPIADYAYAPLARKLHRQVEDSGQSIVTILDLNAPGGPEGDQFAGPESTTDDGESDGGEHPNETDHDQGHDEAPPRRRGSRRSSDPKKGDDPDDPE